jgi:hypothetical protein
VASSVMRLLIAGLPVAQTTLQRTHLITGMDTICQDHRDQYAPVLKALTQFEPDGNAAVATAATTLLSNAEKAPVDVPLDLKDRFAKVSPIAAAFAPDRSRTRRNQSGGT